MKTFFGLVFLVLAGFIAFRLYRDGLTIGNVKIGGDKSSQKTNNINVGQIGAKVVSGIDPLETSLS